LDTDFLARAETMFLDAATEPDAWVAALDMLAKGSGARGAALLTVEGRGPFILPTQEMGELAERYVKEGWYQQDFRYAGIPLMKQRGIFVDQDIVTPEAMGRMPYYAELLQPMGFGWFAGLKVGSEDDLWCLTLQRSMTTGPFLAEEQERLNRIGAIASRAAALARRLDYMRLDGAMEAAEALSGACLFIDRFGRVVKLNRGAEAMVGRAFQLRQGRIRFAHAASEPLQRHIDAAIWPDLTPDAAAHRPVIVPQPGALPLLFRAVRLRGGALGAFAPAYAMLLVSDLNDRAVPAVEHLQAAFQLTLSEARLANALMERFNLVDVAAALNCTHETVRTQIKLVFAKTGTRNQAQLVDLLGRLRLWQGSPLPEP
jgi:DNA-binding CsgD family transcriptional regulator